jgi:hypothetical protein
MSGTPAPQGGIFVGTGSFLVDRKQALDKLMRFQLPNPAGFPLLWLRCAAASGATFFSIDRQGSVVVIRFDGRPLRHDDVADPYRCLFERTGPATARNRMLAGGLLSALGLKPSLLRVASGKGKARVALRLYSLEREEFEPPKPDRDTVIEAAIGSARNDAVRLLREGCGLSQLKIIVDGEVQPGWQSGGHRCTFQDNEAYGWVEVPLASEHSSVEQHRHKDTTTGEPLGLNVTPPAMKDSSIMFYSHGVLIEQLKLKLPVAPVVASINDDRFALNASQCGVVRDGVFRHAVQRLDKPCEELIRSEAAALAQSLPAIARRFDQNRARRAWRERLEPQQDRIFLISSAADATLSLLETVRRGSQKQFFMELQDAVQVVAWLRDVAAASSLLKSTPKAAALRAAPLFMGVDGGVLSLGDLADEVRQRSYLPYSFRPAWGAALPFRALWALWPGEEHLAAQLLGGARERNVTEVVRRYLASAHNAGSATFEQAGLPAPLIRSELHAAGYFGEVGLLAAPAAQGQLHLLTQGIPSGLLEGGPLLFTAVAAGSKYRWDSMPLTADIVNPQLFATARADAERLYPKLAEELDSADSSATGAAIRAHLVDFLAIELEKRGTEVVGGSTTLWIANQPLFLTSDGAASFAQILARIETGEIVYVARQLLDHARNRGFWITIPRFDEALVSRLFRQATVASAGPDVLAVLWPPSSSCQTAGGKCAFAFRNDEKIFHTACPDKRFSWKTVTLHGADSAGDIAVDLAGHEELIVQLMAALIRQAGTLHDQPDHPLRELLLKLLTLQPPPWRGTAGQELWNVVRGRPFFRGGGEGWMLEDIYAALQDPSARLTYSANALEPADLILDEDELGALRVFPATVQLARYGEPGSCRPVIEPGESMEAAGPADERTDASAGVAFRGAQLITRREPFFIRRRYRTSGLDVWLGIPATLPPPKPAFVPGGKANLEISELPPLAYVLVDAVQWTKTGRDSAVPVLIEMLRSLYSDLADCWPVIPLGSKNFQVIQRYVLEAAHFAGKDKKLVATWGVVGEKLLKLPLYEKTDGRWMSLEQLGKSVRIRGALKYADLKKPMTRTERRLVVKILSMKRRKPMDAPRASRTSVASRASSKAQAASPNSVRPATPHDLKRMPSKRPSWLQGTGAQSSAIELAFRLLVALQGRKGMRLRHIRGLRVSSLRLDQNLPHSPLTIRKRNWILDERHPLVATVLKSALSPEEQAPYLASIAFTAANRLISHVTDEDDIRFQEALSTLLAPPGTIR